MAKNVVVVGTQWGDEGKGKIVDWLTEHAQGVVRFQGGHNAGHTLVIKGQKDGIATDSVGDHASRCQLLYRQWRGAFCPGFAERNQTARKLRCRSAVRV